MSAKTPHGLQGSPEPGPPRDVAMDPPAPSSPRLVPFCFWLPHCGVGLPASSAADAGMPRPEAPDPAALEEAISIHLASLGHLDTEPLRWAITAVDSSLGLQLEGVGIRECAAAESQRSASLPGPRR